MSFIQLQGLNDVKPPVHAAEGRYPLTIVDAKIVEKEGKTNVRTIIRIDDKTSDGGSYENVFHYIALPNKDDDKEKVQTKLRMSKQFLVQFGVPFDNGFDVEQLVGCTAEGNLKVEEYEGTPKNVLKTDPLPQDE